MSEVKVNKISPRTNCGTVQLGDAGDTITVTGDLKSNSLKSASGSTITLGQSGDTIQLGCGASQTGFGRTGTVNWDTTAKTASFTAVSGNGYFVNTTSGAITVTLPASPSAGDIVAISDYAGTSATNNITIARNGSNFEGGTANGEIITNRQAVTLVYIDGTQGWVPVGESDSSFQQPLYVAATGGTIITCGDYKIHTFTSPGTFCVTCAGNSLGNNKLDYLVVAGGGSAGGAGNPATYASGGGGAGGYRESKAPGAPWTASPLATCASLTASSGPNAVTVGGGGAAATQPTKTGGKGNNSVFMTITSAGGGGGTQDGGYSPAGPFNSFADGGSGGGSGASPVNDISVGNSPPVSPPQGNAGGYGSGQSETSGGGGGGAGGVADHTGPNNPGTKGGNGGVGVGTGIHPNSPTPVGTPGPSGPLRYFAGGGGGGYGYNGNPAGGSGGGDGGYGGGANGTNTGNTGNNGTTNTGGGGGGVIGSYGPANASGGTGGSGIVVIRYKYQ